VRHGSLAEAREALGGGRLGPPSRGRDPARRSEVVERDHRHELMVTTTSQHAAVVLQLGPRELSLLGLYARPFDREAVGVEAQAGQELDVLPIEVVMIAPFVAPAVRPDTILRWKNSTRITSGAVRIIDAAA
jgi:hypothetical protein